MTVKVDFLIGLAGSIIGILTFAFTQARKQKNDGQRDGKIDSELSQLLKNQKMQSDILASIQAQLSPVQQDIAVLKSQVDRLIAETSSIADLRSRVSVIETILSKQNKDNGRD
jgi:septal ring factor EnvC (AmiA/AmiB activator)